MSNHSANHCALHNVLCKVRHNLVALGLIRSLEMDGKTLTGKRMAIGDKTRCYRQSKRHELLSGQWEAKRMENHRKRIENIAPRIDAQTPKSATFQHVKVRDDYLTVFPTFAGFLENF